MKFITRKLITLIITLFIVSFLAFWAFQVIPGDPAAVKLGTSATPESLEALREEMGLNRPFLVRYGSWLRDFLFGDMGQSYNYSMSVREMLGDKLPITAALMGLAFGIIVLIGLPVGIFSAGRQDGPLSGMLTVLNQIVMAVPPLFLGILLTFLFGVVIQLFTPLGFVSYQESVGGFLAYMVFPALAIALPKSAMTVRLIRTSVRSELERDYVRTAYSRGNSKTSALYRHILRNIAVPAITFLVLTLAMMITDCIVVEQVFSVPGLGRLLISAIGGRDFPVVQAVVVIIASFVMVLNFLSDVLYQVVDPRIRLD